MFELGKHRRITVAVAVLLLLPLVFIAWYVAQILTGASAFKGITEVCATLPDGTEKRWTEEADVAFYTSLLEHASVVDQPVRDVEGETPVTLSLDGTAYRLYPSLSPSGCMAQFADDRFRLLAPEDATALLVRPEMEYVYASYLLPTLTVCSGERQYPVSPDSYTWNYRKADGAYYQDGLTQTSDETVTCNLFADFSNDLSFSTKPSNYGLTVYGISDGGTRYELDNITSFAGLQFSQDTLLEVEVNASWSQASNAERYGDAKYSFRVLYDVPAQVEAVGASENGEKSVVAGGYVLLKALYTNQNEDLTMTTDLPVEPAVFHYDSTARSSYAALPIPADTEPGAYTITVTSGETHRTVDVRVTDAPEPQTLTYTISDADYTAYLAPAELETLAGTLRQLRLASDGTPHLSADLAFGSPVSGEVDLAFGSTVILGNSAVEGTGMKTLEGTLYKSPAGADVHAVQSGVCVFSGALGAFGNAVVIDHGCGIFSYYYHLEASNVTVGTEVTRSATVGTVGKSGYTGTGNACLHFALSVGDTYVSP